MTTQTTDPSTYEPGFVPAGTRREGKLAVFIGRCPCKGCTTVKTVQLATYYRADSKNANWCPGSNIPPYYVNVWKRELIGSTPELYCAKHRRLLAFREVDGKVNPDHICDSRCTGARGHSCECSCGGANHGKDWM